MLVRVSGVLTTSDMGVSMTWDWPMRLVRTLFMLSTVAGLALAGQLLSAPIEGRGPSGSCDDWNLDLAIDTLARFDSGRLAMDADTNGDIYVGLLARDTLGHDTIRVWRTTDGGLSWLRIVHLGFDSTTGHVRDYALRVGHDSTGTFVYNFLVREAPNAGLWLLRFRPDMTDSVTIAVAAGESVRRVSADRSTEWPERLLVSWESDSGAVSVAASSDCGQTWPVARQIPVAGSMPSVCSGGDGNAYVAANAPDSASAWVAVFRDSLANPEVAFTRFDSGSVYRVWSTSIAADRSSPDPEQTVVLVYCARDRSTARCATSVDGGRDWAVSIWPIINVPRTTWETRSPFVRQSYDDNLIRGVVTMHEPSCNWDTLVYAFCRPESPTTWEQRSSLNNFRASRHVGAVVEYSPMHFGGCIAYANYTGDRLYFDAYGFTGIEDKQTVPTRQFPLDVRLVGSELRIELAADGRVTVTMLDCAGRVVARPFDGRLKAGLHQRPLHFGEFARGCYFVRVDAAGATRTVKTLRLR
jgi:hypothetical protein